MRESGDNGDIVMAKPSDVRKSNMGHVASLQEYMEWKSCISHFPVSEDQSRQKKKDSEISFSVFHMECFIHNK